MSKGWIIAISVVAIMVLGGGILFGTCIGISNEEKSLRNLISAKQTDNKSEFDNMWKKISTTAEVSQGQKEALKEIFESHASARKGQSSGGALATWIQESVPNVDLSTYNNLQNIIVASRDGWTMRQKEIIDMKRTHDNLIDLFPSSMVLGFLGREKINIQIVTSSRTEESFETGLDDEVSVFK